MPPLRPGRYHVIVRPDIFNQVFEEENEANNRGLSAGTLGVTVDQLQLDVPLATTLSTGQDRLYQITVPQGQTLQIQLSTAAADAANELFAKFLADYPLDPRNPQILLLMNRKSVHEKKWDEAIGNWRRIVSKYPKTDQASTAQYSIAVTLETELGKLEEALEEYRKVTWGRAQSDARQAVVRLKMPREGVCRFTDRIRGSMEFEWAREQDHVIQRADGSCLYHLASVVEVAELLRADRVRHGIGMGLYPIPCRAQSQAGQFRTGQRHHRVLAAVAEKDRGVPVGRACLLTQARADGQVGWTGP